MEETKKEELKISQGDLMAALQSIMPNLSAKALPDNKWIIQTDGHTLITFDDTLRHYKLASNFIKLTPDLTNDQRSKIWLFVMSYQRQFVDMTLNKSIRNSVERTISNI